jgi:hypothetical protein
MRNPRILWVTLLAALATGCLRYEFEHEFWLRADGSGQVYITGRPELWHAFKGIGRASDPETSVTPEAVRALFMRSGVKVRKVALTHRGGRPYIFVSADFDDVSRLSHSLAFPDLEISLKPAGDRMRLEGAWRRATRVDGDARVDPSGAMAVRFHLPSRIYEQQHAAGVERGNILSWREDVGAALRGDPLVFTAVMDQKSILWSTISLFATAIGAALCAASLVLYGLFRSGRRGGG